MALRERGPVPSEGLARPVESHAVDRGRLPEDEAYDRGAKFRHYKSIAPLQEYVLVGSVERLVDHYRRLETGHWELASFEEAGSFVPLPALGVRLPFDEIYEGSERLPV